MFDEITTKEGLEIWERKNLSFKVTDRKDIRAAFKAGYEFGIEQSNKDLDKITL